MNRSSTGTSEAIGEAADAITANEMVYNSLKDEILSNRLRPGSKLVHQALAESLGVSRTPIRESLERLFQEGFLFRVRNRGYYVAEINVQEVGELYETRLALEAHTLRRLLKQGLTDADFALLDALHEQYEASLGSELTRQRTVIDRDFHLALARMSGNQYLYRALEGIFERIMLKRRVDGYNGRGERPFQEHARLIAALRANDAETAAAELTAHIENAKSRLLRHLAALSDATIDKRRKRGSGP